jgi:hypothetical protein
LLVPSVALPLAGVGDGVDDADELESTALPESWSRGVTELSPDSHRIMIYEQHRIGTETATQVLHCPPNRGQSNRGEGGRGRAE